MSEFQFITISSEPKAALKNAASRRLIRTTATKATRSKHAVENSQKHQTQSDAARESSQRGGMIKFRTQKTIGNQQIASAKKPLPQSLPSSICVWDPVVGPLGGQAWTLLHYYRYVFRARSWAINAKRDWFAFVIEDPAAIHATLSFVSLNRDLEEGSLVSRTSLHHRAKALQLIRQRLNSPQSSNDDSIIGAIALLAITEGLEGNTVLSAAHVQALSRLVGLRGGFTSLSKNEALSRLVAWANLCHTSSSRNYPHLPGLSVPAEIIFPPESVALVQGAAATFHRTVRKMMPSETYRLVKILAALPRYPPTDQVTANEKQSVSHLIYCMNQILLSVKQKDESLDSKPSTLLARVLHRAAFLYIVLVLRQMPRRTNVVTERATSLYELLGTLHFDDYWHTTMEEAYLVIQLWSLSAYFCSLLPQDRNEGLYAKMRRLIKSLHIDNHKDLQEWLAQVTWVDGFDRDGLELLFVGIELR